jgi:hypothetical protein
MEFVVVLYVLMFLTLALAGVLAYGIKRKAKYLRILFRLFQWFEFCVEVGDTPQVPRQRTTGTPSAPPVDGASVPVSVAGTGG